MITDLDSLKINFSPAALTALNVILGFIMFGISLELSKDDFIKLLNNRKATAVGLLAHFLLLPLLTFLLIKILHPTPSIALGMLLVGCCPGGNMSNMFTHFAKGNTALAVGLTSVSHLLAIVLTPLNFSFYGSLDDSTAMLLRQIHLSFADVFATIFLVVIVPLTAGMFLNYYRPGISTKLKVVMKWFSLIAFAVFLVAAFAGNAKIFVSTLGIVLPLVMMHNALALGSGYTFARLAGLSFKECKTITFETGVQNSGLGLILIFTFFNGMGGMALIAACWGVWHLVSGGVLAYVWGNRS